MSKARTTAGTGLALVAAAALAVCTGCATISTSKTGTLDGVSVKGTDIEVWGRIHAVCVNRSLVVVRVTGPREYRALYKDTIYPKFRSTVRFTR